MILSRSVFDKAKNIAIIPNNTENILAIINSHSGEVVKKPLNIS